MIFWSGSLPCLYVFSSVGQDWPGGSVRGGSGGVMMMGAE